MRSPPLLVALVSLAGSPAAVPDRVIPLFNGKDLSGWEADVPAKDADQDAPDSFIVREGMLASLGKPEGHLLTTKWNTMVIEARDRTLKVWVNGDLVNEGFGSTADRGRIAIQAEGTEVEFRKVEIGPLPPAPK